MTKGATNEPLVMVSMTPVKVVVTVPASLDANFLDATGRQSYRSAIAHGFQCSNDHRRARMCLPIQDFAPSRASKSWVTGPSAVMMV